MLLIARMCGDSIFIGPEIEVKLIDIGQLMNSAEIRKGEPPFVDSNTMIEPRRANAIIGVNAPRNLLITRFRVD